MIKKLLLCLISILCLQAATPKDTIIVAVENEPDRINPVFSEDHDAAIGIVFSGLTRFDEEMRIAPDLAKSWKISPDGLIYEFNLRDDVLWHDGVKFSAQDVEFTLNSLKNPKLNAPTKVNFEMIETIKVLSPTQIQIKLTSPFPAFLDALSVGILPKHLLQNQDLNTTHFNQNPIGTGPFKFKKWKKGQYMSFEANTNYHLGKVLSPKLILKLIPDPSITSIELQNQSIDVGLVDFSLAKNFANKKGFKLLIESSADYRALMFNLNNPLFKDPKVRIALNLAINKKEMVASLLHSFGFIAYHPLQKSWASPEKYPTLSYDPKQAQTLLEQAGWKKNKQGILQKGSQIFGFDIYVMSNDPLRVAMASVIKGELAKLGIEVQVVAKPRGSFDYTKTDSFLVGWGSPYDPDFHTYRNFTSMEDSDTSPNGWNFGHYKNKQVDTNLTLARQTLDISQRKKHYANFISALHQDPPYIFLAYLQFPLVYSERISGIKPHILGHHGVGFTWNVYEWSKQ